jgi:plasmid segregation protein ParM
LENALAVSMDVGHSCVKLLLALPHYPAVRLAVKIPTVVYDATSVIISNDETRRRADLETVSLRDRRYFIGNTAIRQGRATAFTGQDRDWTATDAHDVLVIGAWQKGLQELATWQAANKHLVKPPTKIALVLGLPAAFFTHQKEALQKRVHDLITPLLTAGQVLTIRIRIQSESPLIQFIFDSNGKMDNKHRMSEEHWGVIEIGHYTTDFAICDHGDMVEYGNDSTMGVKKVYEDVGKAFQTMGLSADIETVEAAITTKSIMVFGKKQDVSEIVDKAVASFSQSVVTESLRLLGDSAQRLNGVLVAGGGAGMVYDEILKSFPNAIKHDDPRFAVAEGYVRVALAALHAGKEASSAAQ